MFKSLQSRDLMVRIVLGVILVLVSVGMLLYLVPAPVSSLDQGTEGIADVAGERITATDVRRQLEQISSRQQIPTALQGLYARQILDQLILDRLMTVQAERLGLQVSDEEVTNRIKTLLPDAFPGGKWVGEARYAAEVQLRFRMSVEDFEQQVRSSILEEEFRGLVSSGITVAPAEVQEEFQRRNEKVKIDYVVLQPESLQSQVTASEADLQAYYEKNKPSYQVPERRSARYLLLDLNLLRQHTAASDDELRASYNDHIDVYKIPNRAHVEHILFKTVGKTDAEVAEIRKKAEDVLQKAKQGANFEDLAKKYSEDTTKDKGGDLGWIVQGQTVPEFEHAAFTLPKGAISDLVQTQYGFHIIKVLDRETAHTRTFEEVRASILPSVLNDKVERLASNISEKMADAVRQSNRKALEEVAKSLEPLAPLCFKIGETPPLGVDDPIADPGKSPELRDALFRQRPGELSLPIQVSQGYVILSVKDVVAAHQGTFAEVRARVEADYRKEKGIELARSRAVELERRTKSGESLASAAKALGLEMKTSDSFSRTGSIPVVGGATQVGAAFTMPVGQTSPATLLGTNWVIYSVVSRDEPNPDDFAKQKTGIEQELLNSKREDAFEAFKTALKNQMIQEGKLVINAENLKRLTGQGNSNSL